MPIDYEAGGDISTGGKWLDQEGWYHFVVLAATETPTKRDGTIIPGAIGKLEVACLASTVPGQEDKTTEITLFPPSASHKDGGDFARKVLDRTWLALSLMTQQQIETKAKVRIDLTQVVSRQFIARMVKDDKYLRLNGADIYHVDDPDVKDQPKNMTALKALPAAQRRVSSQGAAKQQTVAASSAPAATPAATSFDDL